MRALARVSRCRAAFLVERAASVTKVRLCAERAPSWSATKRACAGMRAAAARRSPVFRAKAVVDARSGPVRRIKSSLPAARTLRCLAAEQSQGDVLILGALCRIAHVRRVRALGTPFAGRVWMDTSKKAGPVELRFRLRQA
jgi:hypothetical protein